MAIGTINVQRLEALNTVITQRADALNKTMIVMDLSGANQVRSGSNAASYSHSARGGNFSVTA